MAITLNDVRFSYCNLFQPRAQNGQEPKYSVTVLVPKTNVKAKAAMDAAIQDALKQGVSTKWNGQMPPKPALCVHDGDGERPSDGQPFGPECKGCWVFTASSKNPPFVVDSQVQPIIDPTQVYSGMWGNISVNFFPYNFNGKKGIGCGLNGVQKTRDGEPLGGGRITAEEAFTAVSAPAPAAPAPAAPTYGYSAAPSYGGTPAYSAATDYSAAAAQTAVNPFTGMPW